MAGRRYALYLLIMVSLLIGLFTGQAALFNLAYLFGAVYLLGLVWTWWAVRGLGIGRVTRTRRSQVGRTFGETFILRNLTRLPKLWLDIQDFSTLPGHASRSSQIIPPLRSRSSYDWHVETLCRARGEFTLGPLEISSGDPFGLFSLRRRINAIERVIVYPLIVELSKFSLPLGVLSGGDAQSEITQQVTTNAAGVREYVPGDSINRIHWKATARRGKLIVKEFELDPFVDIWLFVDFSQQSLVEDPMMRHMGSSLNNGYILPPSTEEYSVVIAASLAQYFLSIERAIGFAAYIPHREVYAADRTHRQQTRIMETLAVAHSNATYSLQQMLALEVPSLARGTSVILITSSLDSAWVAEAQVAQRRGVRPMCIFIEPTSFGGLHSSEELRVMLQLAKIPTLVVRNGDNIATALEQKPI